MLFASLSEFKENGFAIFEDAIECHHFLRQLEYAKINYSIEVAKNSEIKTIIVNLEA